MHAGGMVCYGMYGMLYVSGTFVLDENDSVIRRHLLRHFYAVFHTC